MKKMWEFKTKNFVVTWHIEKEPVDTNYMEPSLAHECETKVRSGEWKCFTSRIQVVHRVTGEVLGEDWLGNSIYASPAEFRDHIGMNGGGYGSYFSQMVREALQQARTAYPVVLKRMRKDVAAKQAAVACTLRR
jgi:hypothetical protein